MLTLLKLGIRGLNLLSKTAIDKVNIQATSKASILTSVISGIGFLLITLFIAIMLLCQAFGWLTPPVPTALDSLFDYLIWIQGAMLGISSGSAVIGGRQRRREIAKQITEHKNKQLTTSLQRNSLNATATSYTAIIRRDYEQSKNRTLSLVELYKDEELIGNFKSYELNKTHKGLENVVGKTCIPEGQYIGKYACESASGKFADTGIYFLEAVPNRTGILIHYGGSRKQANKYIRGCIMLYKELVGNRIMGSRDEMKRFVELTNKEDVLLNISS